MSQAIIEAQAKALFEDCQMDGKSLICAYARDDSIIDEIKDPEARAEVLDAIKTGILKKFK